MSQQTIAVLVMAYGGPNRIEDVQPYLLDIRAGRPTPDSIVEEVRHRYELIGGRSPILEETQDQAGALQAALDELGDPPWRVFVGMKHWHPFIAEAAAEIEQSGIQRLVGIVMAPHYSRMSVESYFDRLGQALRTRSVPMEVARIASWKDDPGYLDTLEARIRSGLARFPAAARPEVTLIFTAHSLPKRILEWSDPYPNELAVTVQALKARFPDQRSHFAYQSAAMTTEPWLGPEAGDLMLSLIEDGTRHFLVIPIGFVSEHVEILYDVDIDYRRRVEARGGRLERIEMPGSDPRLMTSLAQRVRAEAGARGWL
ncbi:MAG: ferrochelatase [Anaerolineales bacterium]